MPLKYFDNWYGDFTDFLLAQQRRRVNQRIIIQAHPR